MSSVPSTPGVAAQPPAYPRTLTTPKIIVLIIAALTPLSVIVGTMPLGLAFGGPSTTLMFVAAGALIGLFSVGYVQMVRRISRPGAFYSYIARGLGRPAGVGAAMVAVVAYAFSMIALYSVQAFVTQQIIQATFGVDVPWQLCFMVQLILVTVLAYRRIDLSAMVTFVVVTLELLVLLALVVAIAADKGLGAFPIEAVSPSVFNIGQWTVAFVFAILCYAGFEAGAMYAPEAKNPERTVPRALYGALVVLTASFALVAWALTSVTGVEGQQAAVSADMAGFIFTTTGHYLGAAGVWILSVLAIFAQVACALAVTNFTSRYFNSLAKEDLLPPFLGRKNRHGSPGTAILALTGLTVAVVLGLATVGVDPYTQIAPVGFGLAAIGATALQAMASGAVIAYFLRQPRSERHWWKTSLAPIIATVLLAAALYIELISFSYITGTDSPEMLALPWIVPVVAAFGVAFGFWLKKNRSHTYEHLAAGDTAEEADALHAQRVARRAGTASQSCTLPPADAVSPQK
ncbi:APC family permease [Arthrobacter methylotrophus]|uniref:APC family permease n=1 Tax=Arthrobacter methylotrophus TaxID=121291 RepID=A0ABV5UM41_9MICC